MGKIFAVVCIMVSIFALTPAVYAQSILGVNRGGTGNSNLTAGTFLLGNGTSPIIASSSPTILRNFIDNYIYNSSVIPHVAGTNIGDILSWSGSAWAAVAPAAFGGVAGGQNEIQFNDSGAFSASAFLKFYPFKVHKYSQGPTLQIGDHNQIAVDIVANGSDSVSISTTNAESGSNKNGSQLAIGSGDADGEGKKGGTLWLVSGGGDIGGDILISSANNSQTAGTVYISSSQNSSVHVDPGAVTISGKGGTGFSVYEDGTLQQNGNVKYQQVGCMFADGKCIFKLSEHQPTVADGSGDCGTSPVLTGSDNAGRIIVGSGTNGGKCTVTFADGWGTEWTNPPICIVQNESNANAVRPSSATVDSFEIVGTISDGDSLVYQCMSY